MRPNPPIDPKASLWNLISVYLRLQREHRGLSGEALGRIIGASKATVSRIENGKDRLDIGHAKLLDVAWETSNPELLEGGLFEWLIFFASLGHRPQWGTEFVKFEQKSRLVKVFDPSLIAGLIQTEDYARALFEAWGAADPECDVRIRMERKAILDKAFVTVVLSENALTWPVGSPEIMKAQLAHVLDLAEHHPRVLVHIIPKSFDTGAYPGLMGSLQFATGDDFGEVAYTETMRGGRLVATPAEVAEFAISYARILGKALPEIPSRALIKKALEEFNGENDVAEE